MRKDLLIVAAVIMIVGSIINNQLKTERGAVDNAFGWSCASNQQMDEYRDTVHREFAAYLAKRGFTETTNRCSMQPEMDTRTETSQWFEGRLDGSLPFYVVVALPQKDSSGIEVAVINDDSNYLWRVNRTQKAADNMTADLSQWWHDYVHQNPGPLRGANPPW